MNSFRDFAAPGTVLGTPGVSALIGMGLDRIAPDSPVAGWFYLLSAATVIVGGVIYRVVSRTSEDTKVVLVLLAIMGPLPVLLALSTYVPQLGLTTWKIALGYGVALAAAAAIAGVVYMTRRIHKD